MKSLFFMSIAVMALGLGNAGLAKAEPITASSGGGIGGGGGVLGGADPQFSFTYSDGLGDSGFGTLNTVSSGLGDGSLLATSGSLTVTAGPVAPPGTYALILGGSSPTLSALGTFIYDDLIYPNNNAGNGATNGTGGLALIGNPSYLSNGGLLFGTGTFEINIFGNGGGDYAGLSAPPAYTGAFNGGSFTLTPAVPVPEPASLTLLGVGVVGLVGYGWRRRKLAVA